MGGRAYILTKETSAIVRHKYFCGLQAHNVAQGSKLALLALLALFVFYIEDLRLWIFGYWMLDDVLALKLVKPTAPGVPRQSPIQVLSWPDNA